MFLRGRRKLTSQATLAQPTVSAYLQKVDVFKDLTSQEIETLFHGVMLRQCTPGTVFFSPEESSQRLFILKEGRVDLYRLTPSGRRLVTRRIGPGTVFGEMGLLGQTMQGCFAEATESSLVCVATREDVVQLFKQHPDMAMRMLETVGIRLKMLEERLEQAVFSPVKARLANFLLANTDAAGVVTGYTHAEIGDTIGALRQTVTEALNELHRQGAVEIGHKQIRVKERKALEEMTLSE